MFSWISITNHTQRRVVVVAQLLPTPEISSSNPVIGKFYQLNWNCIQKTKIKKKRPAQFKKTHDDKNIAVINHHNCNTSPTSISFVHNRSSNGNNHYRVPSSFAWRPHSNYIMTRRRQDRTRNFKFKMLPQPTKPSSSSLWSSQTTRSWPIDRTRGRKGFRGHKPYYDVVNPRCIDLFYWTKMCW